MKTKDLGFDSLCVVQNKEIRTTRPHILPLYATSSFALENLEEGIEIFTGKRKGHVYGRYANPTIDTVAEKIASLESFGCDFEAAALFTSSGMSAISTLLMGLLKQGDAVLTQGNLYGGSTELLLKILEPLGVKIVLQDLKDLEGTESQLKTKKNIKLIYCETPANPTMACVDLKALAELAQKYEVLTAVDNTFASPYLQRPLTMGMDFSIHSTTKYLNGHGNGIAGIIVAKDPVLLKEKVWTCMKLTGTTGNPWDAWLVNNGMKTLALRMEKHCSNAQALAEFLEKHPAVGQVNYPGLPAHPDHALAKSQMSGFGGMMSFELKEGLEAAKKLLNGLQLCSLAPTLGDVDTLVLHPVTSSHINVPKEIRERNGIRDGLVRVSVGIEAPEDIITDFERAFV